MVSCEHCNRKSVSKNLAEYLDRLKNKWSDGIHSSQSLTDNCVECGYGTTYSSYVENGKLIIESVGEDKLMDSFKYVFDMCLIAVAAGCVASISWKTFEYFN